MESDAESVNFSALSENFRTARIQSFGDQGHPRDTRPISKGERDTERHPVDIKGKCGHHAISIYELAALVFNGCPSGVLRVSRPKKSPRFGSGPRKLNIEIL